MKIRKQYKFEAAHIVRGCSSKRCSHSFHGHSYIVEVFLETKTKLDNGFMAYDFGLMKGTIGEFLDKFDHSIHFWNQDLPEIKDFMKEYNDRWIELPFSPSAEAYSIFFLDEIRNIIEETEFKNGEAFDLTCSGVRVHETATGWAESCPEDTTLLQYNRDEVIYSNELRD